MSDLQIEEVAAYDESFAPDDGEDAFCHIIEGSGTRFYCGKPNPSGTHPCGLYKGELVCPSCSQVTCPTCAVRADLDDRLQDADVQ